MGRKQLSRKVLSVSTANTCSVHNYLIVNQCLGLSCACSFAAFPNAMPQPTLAEDEKLLPSNTRGMLENKALNPTEVGKNSVKSTTNQKAKPRKKIDPDGELLSELSTKTPLREELMENLFNFLHVNK